MSEYTIKTITAEDGTEYTPCETSEADGLWSNGKFIEGKFGTGYICAQEFLWNLCNDKDWKALGAIPVKKVVPKKEPYQKTVEGFQGGSGMGDALRGTYRFRDLPCDSKRYSVTVREITEQEPAPKLAPPKDGGLER